MKREFEEERRLKLSYANECESLKAQLKSHQAVVAYERSARDRAERHAETQRVAAEELLGKNTALQTALDQMKEQLQLAQHNLKQVEQVCELAYEVSPYNPHKIHAAVAGALRMRTRYEHEREQCRATEERVIELTREADRYRGQIQRQAETIDRLQKENERYLWNLAGCTTIAEAERPSDFDESMALPALFAVRRLAEKLVVARSAHLSPVMVYKDRPGTGWVTTDTLMGTTRVSSDENKCNGPGPVEDANGPAKTVPGDVLDQIRQALARGYCSSENSGKTVDPVLVEAMASEIVRWMDARSRSALRYGLSPRAWFGMLSDDHKLQGHVLNGLAMIVHRANAKWWVNIDNGEPLQRNVGEMLMLAVTELAEAMEGHRKNKMDDHLPHRRMFEVEIVDTIIRLLDIGAGLTLDLGGAFVEKMAYNATRQDHTLEARRAAGGKKC